MASQRIAELEARIERAQSEMDAHQTMHASQCTELEAAAEEARREAVDVRYALEQSEADYGTTLADMEGAQERMSRELEEKSVGLQGQVFLACRHANTRAALAASQTVIVNYYHQQLSHNPPHYLKIFTN